MSRMIGRVYVDEKEFCVNQHQEARPNGTYAIKDTDKRAQYETEKRR